MQFHFRFLQWGLLFTAVMAWSGCSESSSPAESDEGKGLEQGGLPIDDDAAEGTEAKVRITASQGGTVRVKTGAQVKIEANALTKDLEIGMSRPANKEAANLVKGIPAKKLASAPYVVTPHGTQFKIPAEVKLPVDPKSSGKRVKVQWLKDEADTQWKNLAEGKVVDGKATVKVRHFSVLVLVVMDDDEALPPWDDADNEGDGDGDGDGDGGDGDGDGDGGEPEVAACGPGRYDAQEGGKPSCKACPAGTYNAFEKALSCIPHSPCTGAVLVPGSAVLNTVCAGDAMLSLAAGEHHTCAVTSLGAVKCWGNNGFGQAGASSEHDAVLATTVSLAGSAREVAASEMHTCAALFDGRVACWGGAEGGQLTGVPGAGSESPLYVPSVVQAVGVAAHAYGSCAVLADGNVTCWGMDVNAHEIVQPQTVAELKNITKGVGGRRHLCFLDQAGAVWCGGDDESGQLGVGPNELEAMVYRAVELPGAAQDVVAGDSHTCAHLTSGELACWGDNSWGAVGVRGSQVFYPTLVPLPSPVEGVFAGGSTTCATTSEGLYCWGKNEFGEARVAGRMQLDEPTQVGDAVRIGTLGASHGCAVQPDERIACWGAREGHRTNEEAREFTAEPTLVAGSVSDLVLGANTLCTYEGGGAEVLCRGKLPRGSAAEPGYDSWEVFPTAVERPEFNAARTAVSDDWGCAKDAVSGRLTCWGVGIDGEAQDDASEVAFPLPFGISDVQLFGGYGCAIGKESDAASVQNAYCFAKSNANGQLGNATTTTDSASLTPGSVSVPGLAESEILRLAVGESHACFSTLSGAVYCWGRGTEYQHGQSSEEHQVEGTRVELEGAALELVAGRAFTCALLQPLQLGDERYVFCWGKNDYGQVRPLEATPALTPGAAIATGRYTQLVAGDEHACVLENDGRVFCWGRSTFGQAGVLAERTELRQIELSEPVAGLFARGQTTCALTSNLNLYCWGQNASGMLGLSHPFGPAEAVFSL